MRFLRVFLLMTILSSAYCDYDDDDYNNEYCPLEEQDYCDTASSVDLNEIKSLSDSVDSYLIVNSRTLPISLKHNPNVINYYTPKDYLLVFFFTKPCRFSDLAAPHFKLLSKFFPRLETVDYYYRDDDWFNSLISYSVNGFPSVCLFRNGKLETIHNDSHSLIAMTQLILNHTDLRPNKKIGITADDFIRYVNLLPKFEIEDYYDYCLILSWVVILFWILAHVDETIILNVLDRIIIATESLKDYVNNNYGDEHPQKVVNELPHNDGNENLRNGSNEHPHTDSNELPHDNDYVRPHVSDEYFLSNCDEHIWHDVIQHHKSGFRIDHDYFISDDSDYGGANKRWLFSRR